MAFVDYSYTNKFVICLWYSIQIKYTSTIQISMAPQAAFISHRISTSEEGKNREIMV
jgi:hypothetical protein